MAHQTASIEIVNNTGRTLLSVSVAHKYSDNYKNDHTWTVIRDGAATSTTQVDFNTGFLTTGKDWWVVTGLPPAFRTLSIGAKMISEVSDGEKTVQCGV